MCGLAIMLVILIKMFSKMPQKVVKIGRKPVKHRYSLKFNAKIENLMSEHCRPFGLLVTF